MGMRGKQKSKPLTANKRKLINDFALWLQQELEVEYIKYLQSKKFSDFQTNAILNGCGCEQQLKGLTL